MSVATDSLCWLVFDQRLHPLLRITYCFDLLILSRSWRYEPKCTQTARDKNCSKHGETYCYIRCTQKSVYLPFMQNTWPHPLSQRARWLPKCWKESSSRHFDGKEWKTKRVYRSLVHKIEQRSDWRFYSVQLPCLPNCNYGNGSVSWTVNVSYAADFFEP